MALFAGFWGPQGFEEPDGDHAASTSISVFLSDGVTLASIFLDKNRTPIPNPTTTDSLGNLWFFANPGEYKLSINGAVMPIMINLHPDEPLSSGGEGPGGGGGFWEYTQVLAVKDWQVNHGLEVPISAVHVVDNNGNPRIVAWVETVPGTVMIYNGAEMSGAVVMS